MNSTARKLLAAGAGLLALVIIAAGTWLLAELFFPWDNMMGRGSGWRGRLPFTGSFEMNGEQIYFTGTSRTGPQITSDIPGMHRMPGGRMACATCHGPEGRGGPVRMMMTSFQAPDIRYSTLTGDDHGDAHGDHPPYTDEEIRRAIIEGVDPTGEPLEWMMPRWSMTEQQLDDLIAFLKTLE
jgi:cytochrome c oxidase subunit II